MHPSDMQLKEDISQAEERGVCGDQRQQACGLLAFFERPLHQQLVESRERVESWSREKDDRRAGVGLSEETTEGS